MQANSLKQTIIKADVSVFSPIFKSIELFPRSATSLRGVRLNAFPVLGQPPFRLEQDFQNGPPICCTQMGIFTALILT